MPHEIAQDHAENEYDKFSRLRTQKQDRIETDFEKTIKAIELKNSSESKKKRNE